MNDDTGNDVPAPVSPSVDPSPAESVAVEPLPAVPVRDPLTRAEREAMMAEIMDVVRAFVVKSDIPRSRIDETVQDALLAIWGRTGDFDPTRGTKWLTYAVGITRRIITRNLCSNAGSPVWASAPDAVWEKLPARECSAEDDEPDAETDEEATERGLHEAIRFKLSEPLLARLTPKSRQLVEAVAFGGLSPEQVAIQLGYPVKVIKINLQAAIRKMLGQIVPGGKDDHDRRAAKELLCELTAANPTWNAKQLRAELAEFIGESCAARCVGQFRKGVSVERIVGTRRVSPARTPKPPREPKVKAPTSTRTRSMTAEQEERLKSRLQAAAVVKDGVGSLRVEDVRQILKHEFQVERSFSTIYLLVRRLGFSGLRPWRPRPRRKAEDETAAVVLAG